MALRSNASRPVVNVNATALNEKVLRTRRVLSNIDNVSNHVRTNIPVKDTKEKKLKVKAVAKQPTALRNKIIVSEAVKVATRNYQKSTKQYKTEIKVEPKVEPEEIAKPTEIENPIEASPVKDSPVPMEVCEEQGFSTRLLIPDGVDDIDEDGIDNLYLCGLFATDIYDYLRTLEIEQSIGRDFLDIQSDVTGRMRAILIDWLTQVHLKFHLLLETMYLTVAILDRFLQSECILRSELQLVGITAMFIASKYEEMYSPEVEDFVYITDNAYSKKRVLQMECTILKTLEFKLGRPLPIHFLRRNSRAAGCDVVVHTVAKYLMELSLVQLDFACVPPSMLGAAALYLSMKVIDNNSWSTQMSYYSGYTETEVYPVAQQLSELLVKASSQKLKAVHDKYAGSKFLKVSTMPELKSNVVIRMAKVSL